MRILYIINHMDWFWSHRLPLALGAQKKGYEVIVAATGASQDPKLKDLGFTGVELPSTTDGPLPLALLRVIGAIGGILAQHKPDLMHAITIKYAFLAGIAARMRPVTRYVFTIAGLGYLFSGEGLKPKILRNALAPYFWFAFRNPKTRLIFQNPDDLRIMVGRGFANAVRSYLILGSGVDLSVFPHIEEEAAEPPLVVMPTRLVHDKGVSVFVRAAQLCRERGVEAQFQIAGGITANNPLAITEDEMSAMTADGAVTWLGKVSDMPGLLARSSVIAYPSHYREGVPKVLLEACATGRAIVTTDHPGCREAVADNDNGLLVPIKNPEATADAIETLLREKMTRQSMGLRSRARAEEEFDVHLIVEKTLEVYDSALGKDD